MGDGDGRMDFEGPSWENPAEIKGRARQVTFGSRSMLGRSKFPYLEELASYVSYVSGAGSAEIR